MSSDSFLVDHKADAAGKQTERLLDLVGFPRRSVRVAQQYERQVVLLSEISMRVLSVGAYSDHFCSYILERFV